MKKELTIKEKRKYLEAHGWTQLWSNDNWVVKERYEKDDYTNPDLQGLSTEQAFEVEMEYGITDPVSEKKWGGKNMTYERLKERVKELQKKKETKK
jgi:hypothetical protein